MRLPVEFGRLDGVTVVPFTGFEEYLAWCKAHPGLEDQNRVVAKTLVPPGQEVSTPSS